MGWGVLRAKNIKWSDAEQIFNQKDASDILAYELHNWEKYYIFIIISNYIVCK